MTPLWDRFREPDIYLPLSLHSIREADYSREHDGKFIPAVGLGILDDILRDEGIDQREYTDRLATLTAVLLSPVPSATGTLTTADTPTPTSTITPTITLTPQPGLTSSPSPTALQSSTFVPNPTQTKKPTTNQPGIQLVKSLARYDDHDASGSITVGDDLWYRFLVLNTGNTSLSLMSVNDVTFTIPVTCPVNTLAQGASMTCNANIYHRVTQAEANAGRVVNQASATGDYGGVRYVDYDTLTTVVQQNPSITIVKSLGGYDDNDLSGSMTAGDGLWYLFDLTNTGDVTLGNIRVQDDTFGIPVTCPVTVLMPGGTTSCAATAAHVLTPAEISAGELVNTATVYGEIGGATLSASDTLITPLGIQIAKSLAGYADNDSSGTITLGDGLWYQFTVTNIGSVALNTINVTDATFGIPVTCPSSSLPAGNSMVCTADNAHLISLSEANSGTVQNTATVSGQPPAGPIVYDTDTLYTIVDRNGSMTVSTVPNPATYTSVGQVINYGFTVTNNGNVTILEPIVIDVDITLNESCPAGDLAPGSSIVCTASYTISQSDLDSGSVSASAFATGTASGGFVTVSNTDVITVSAVQNPGIQIVKFASSYVDNDSSNTLTFGDGLLYRFNVNNTGNVTLTSVGVTDDSFGISVTCPASALGPGALMTCSADTPHVISLAEADAGQVTNMATAVGNFNSSPYSNSDTITTPVNQDPALSLTKSADVATYDTVGQTITYTYTIRNSGNVSLAGPFTIADDKQGTLTNCATGPLAPGATVACASAHTVTQGDLDFGSITNAASVSGNSLVSAPVSLTLTANQSPALFLTKSGVPTSYSFVGQLIGYTYTVENSGNVTLSGPFTISDDKIGTITPCGGGPLTPGATTSCTGSYPITQIDLDFGSLTNSATAQTTYSGSPVTSNTASITVTTIPLPSYTISKTATDVGGDGSAGHADQAGDMITYQITLNNTGNISLIGVSVSDPMLGALSGPVESGLNDNTLSVGETWTYTGTYAVTQADLDNNGGGDGDIDNTASATTTFLPTPQTASTAVPVDQLPLLTVDKTSTSTDVTAAGQIVPYNYLLTNTGNLTLTGISLSDDNTDAAPVCGATTLAPSATTTCTAQHTVTQAEMDAGGNLVNNVTASSNEAPDATDTLSIPIAQSPSIVLVKSLASYTDNDVSWSITRGDDLWYQFEVTNNGNVTLANVQVTDDTFALAVTCPLTTLSPSATVVCTADTAHTITLIEANAGQVSNSATVSGEHNSLPYTDSDTLVTVVQPVVSSVVSGQVRDDSDGDGNLGDNDAGLANVKIELDNGACTLGVDCRSTLTDANGVFVFNSVADGSYLLVETDTVNYQSTADSDPPNDNQIDVIVLGGVSSTNNIYLDTVIPSTCSAPDPVNGFVVSTNPANGAVGVPLSTTTITVTFNQPMITSGAESVLDAGKYELKNQVSGKTVTVTNVTYDPVTYTATLTIDNSDPDWQGGTLYNLTIKNLKNACGTAQSDVIHSFTTELVIAGQVVNSLDGRGIYGAAVTMTGGSCGASCGSTTTDQNGDFKFAGFAPGSYTLTQTDLPGYSSVSDSNPPNDNLIALTLAAGSNSTGHLFTDMPACLGGANFVASTAPANGAIGVSLSTSTLTVTFNQPMITYGGGSVFDIGNFDNNIDNLTLGGDVPILGVTYDPNTYTATLTIDTTDPQWKPGSQFRLRIKNNLRNACDVKPTGSDVDILFATDLVISGQVRNDLDGDGNLTDPDGGISGVTVSLYNSTFTLIGTTTTNSGGYFSFGTLPPGTYYVRETDPVGYTSTADSFGANDNEITITLVAGTNSIGHKFLDKAP